MMDCLANHNASNSPFCLSTMPPRRMVDQTGRTLVLWTNEPALNGRFAFMSQMLDRLIIIALCLLATLYLHGTSMKNDAAPDGPIEQLVQQGHTFLAAIPALHAAALNCDACKLVALGEMIPSWESLMSATEAVDLSVHGVLRHYDLGDLRKMIGIEGEAGGSK